MEDRKKANTSQSKQRKRIQRMKTMIIAGAVILLLSSVILNFVLLFKVFELQNKMDKLYSDTDCIQIERSL